MNAIYQKSIPSCSTLGETGSTRNVWCKNNLDIGLTDLANPQLVKSLSDQRNMHQAWTVAPIENLTTARLNSKQMHLILEVFKMNQEREGMA